MSVAAERLNRLSALYAAQDAGTSTYDAHGGDDGYGSDSGSDTEPSPRASSSSPSLASRLANLPPLALVSSGGAATTMATASALDEPIPVPEYLARQRQGANPTIRGLLDTCSPAERTVIASLIEDHANAFDDAMVNADHEGLNTLLAKMQTTANALSNPMVEGALAACGYGFVVAPPHCPPSSEAKMMRVLMVEHHDQVKAALAAPDTLAPLLGRLRTAAQLLTDNKERAELESHLERSLLDRHVFGAVTDATTPSTFDANIITRAIHKIKKRRAQAKARRAAKKAAKERQKEEEAAAAAAAGRGTKEPNPSSSFGSEWAEWRGSMQQQDPAIAAATTTSLDASFFERIKRGARKAFGYLRGPRSALVARPYTGGSKPRNAVLARIGDALATTSEGATTDFTSIGATGVSDKGARFTMEVERAKKRFTLSQFSGKERVPMTRYQLGDGGAVIDYYVVTKAGQAVTKGSLLGMAGDRYIGQQLDMHLKGGTVSVKPTFGGLTGVGVDQLGDRVWIAESSGKKGDPLGVFLRFGEGGPPNTEQVRAHTLHLVVDRVLVSLFSSWSVGAHGRGLCLGREAGEAHGRARGAHDDARARRCERRRAREH